MIRPSSKAQIRYLARAASGPFSVLGLGKTGYLTILLWGFDPSREFWYRAEPSERYMSKLQKIETRDFINAELNRIRDLLVWLNKSQTMRILNDLIALRAEYSINRPQGDPNDVLHTIEP